MIVLTTPNDKTSSISKNEEFEKYLMKQRTSTTFNGIEVAEFAWYKKLFGLDA